MQVAAAFFYANDGVINYLKRVALLKINIDF
jgi:hypothetical protein